MGAEVDDVAVAVLGDPARTAGLVDALADAVPGASLPAPPGRLPPNGLAGVDGIVAGPDSAADGSVVAAVASGVPVLCVPPPTGLDEARVLLEAEQGAGRRLVQAGFPRRHDPRLRDLRRHLTDGVVGRVGLVRGTETCEDPDEGLLHALDTVAWLTGRPVSAVRVDAGDDLWLVTVRTRGGPVADVELRLAPGDPAELRWEVVGDEGSAEVEASAAHLAEAHRIMLTAWVRSVGSGAGVGATAEDGEVAARAVHAVRAARGGDWVDVPAGPAAD